MKEKLAEEIYRSILGSIKAVGNSLDPAKVKEWRERMKNLDDEMARNSAQGIVSLLETIEMEGPCPVCGSCPICGKREDHEH